MRRFELFRLVEGGRRFLLGYIVDFYGGSLFGIAALYKVIAGVAVAYLNKVALLTLAFNVF